MGQVAHLAAAELARHGHAEQAHLAQLGPQVLRERVVVVDALRARSDFGFGETAHGIAQRVDLFTQGKTAHISPRNESAAAH
ncbi:hypothetical protein D3C71_1938380 [compost metagenome]